MNFSEWLHQQLTKRSWTHKDLSQHALMAGYKISRVQITNILNENRKAGPDACIAIAYGLGLSREEVFKARGWLLREPREVVPPKASPKAAALIRGLADLPFERQEIVSDALSAVLDVVAQVTEEMSLDAPSEALLQEPEQPAPQIPKTAEELLPLLAELDHLPLPVQREAIDTALTSLATTLRMNQRVEHLSDWFKQEFPDRYPDILTQLDKEYNENWLPKGVDTELKKAA